MLLTMAMIPTRLANAKTESWTQAGWGCRLPFQYSSPSSQLEGLKLPPPSELIWICFPEKPEPSMDFFPGNKVSPGTVLRTHLFSALQTFQQLRKKTLIRGRTKKRGYKLEMESSTVKSFITCVQITKHRLQPSVGTQDPFKSRWRHTRLFKIKSHLISAWKKYQYKVQLPLTNFEWTPFFIKSLT